MSDSKGLNELRDEAVAMSRAKGFRDVTPGESLMLIVTELAEAMEDVRKGHDPNEVWYERPPPSFQPDGSFADSSFAKPCGIPSESADVLIRCFDFCGRNGIDIEAAVREKMLFNESRPFKHGGKKL